MQGVIHEIELAKQPTNISCGQTSLSMLLSFFGDRISSEEIMKDIPMLKNDKGEEWGTFMGDLALWCIRRGYKTKMHVFDSQIISQQWSKLSAQEIINELKTRKENFIHPVLGKNLTGSFIDSYIDYLLTGNNLIISQAATTSLLYQLLTGSPIFITVSYGTLYGTTGSFFGTHFIVVYGNDEQGNFLIADPWKDNERKVIEPELLTAAIMAAQMTCENMMFQISK